MKLFHLGDLHLGKRVNGFSMLEDQKYILNCIIKLALTEKPDGVIIAGDIYDKTIPPGEAVGLLDSFLTELSQLGIFVCAVAGNHDSPERLDFATTLLKSNNIFITGVFKGKPTEVSFNDNFGTVHIFLMPFIKPQSLWPYVNVNRPENYQDAMKICIDSLDINPSDRNIIVAHQFVTFNGSAQRSDSESQMVGGVGEIDASLFSQFDYTALGHLHQPQKMGVDNVRYAGSPLKYSFSEVNQKKGVTVVELLEKGNINISKIPLTPIRDMRQIKGPLNELISSAEEEGKFDYIRAILTDKVPLVDPLGQLRSVYPNISVLDFDNGISTDVDNNDFKNSAEEFSPYELFNLFYEKQNGVPLYKEQLEYLTQLWQEGNV